MSKEMLELCGAVVAVVLLTAGFQRALQPLLRQLLRSGLAPSEGASPARVSRDAASTRRDAPERLGSPA